MIQDIFRFTAPSGRQFPDRTVHNDAEEIEVIISGSGAFGDAGRYRPVGPGDILWFHPGDTIEARSDATAPYVCIVFRFTPPMLDSRAPLRPPRITRWQDPEEGRRFCQQMLTRFHRDLSDRSLFSNMIHNRLLWEAREFGRIKFPVLAPAAVSPVLEKSIQYMDTHYLEPISVDDIARAAGCGRPYLFELFRERFGEPPFQRVIRLRTQHARDLLTSTTLSIKEIAHAAGFSDSVNFCRSFKKQIGQTPGTYRKLLTGI